MATTVGPTGYQVSIPENSDTASIQAALQALVYNYNSGSVPSTTGQIGANSVFGILAPKADPTFTGTITTGLSTAGLVLTNSSGVLSSSATIANSYLANSSVTIGSTSVALGATASTIAGLTSLAATTLTGNLVGDIYASDASTKVLEAGGTGGTGATFTGNVTGNLTGNVTGNYTVYPTSSGSIAGTRKVFVADPTVVGSTGSGLVGAVAGDLWFW